MFTIEATIDKAYDLHVSRNNLREFLAKPTNFARYMPEIIDDVEIQDSHKSLWTLKIDLPLGSPLILKTVLVLAQPNDQAIDYEPIDRKADYMIINIKLNGSGEQTKLQFRLALHLQRNSGYEIYPLASFLGEKAINKQVHSYATGYVDDFIKQVETKAPKKR